MEKSTKQLINMLLGFGLSISTILTIIGGTAISQKIEELREKGEDINFQQQELLAEVRSDESYLEYVRKASAIANAAREKGVLNNQELQENIALLNNDQYIIDLLNKGEQSVLSDELVDKQSEINQMQEKCVEERKECDAKSLGFGMAFCGEMGLVAFNIANYIEGLKKKKAKQEAKEEIESVDEFDIKKQRSVLPIGKLCGVTEGSLLRYDNKSYLRDKYSVIEIDEKTM